MGLLTKVRKVIHKTPVLRQTSKAFAQTFYMGDMYEDFDRKNCLGSFKDQCHQNQQIAQAVSQAVSTSNSKNIYGTPPAATGGRGFITKFFSWLSTGKFA